MFSFSCSSRKAWALSLLARVNCFQKKQKSRRAQSADSSEASDYDFDVLKCLEGEYIRFDSFDSPEMLRMCSSTGEGSGNFLTSTGNFAAYEQLTTGESGFPSSSEVAANSSEQDGASDPWPRAELMALNDVGGENNRQFSNPPTGSDDSVVGSNQKSDESCVSNQTHGGKIDDEGQGLGHDASGSSPQAVNTIASSER